MCSASCRGGLWAACLIVVLKLQALSGSANACVNGSHGLGLGEMVAGEGVEAELEVETILTARAQCACMILLSSYAFTGSVHTMTTTNTVVAEAGYVANVLSSS